MELSSLFRAPCVIFRAFKKTLEKSLSALKAAILRENQFHSGGRALGESL